MSKKEIFEEEKAKLKDVIELINRKIEIAEKNFDEQEHFIIGFKEGLRGTQFNRQGLMSLYATEIYDLKALLPSPYFGRFTFQKQGDNEPKKIYIGKKSLTDEFSKIISYDWRSPVCSMYYDYNIGEAEYISNGQKVRGKILGKRQIAIQNGVLKSVDEQDTLSNDSILMKYLRENADSRLRTIVATIQREQNTIIRNPISKNYIVQGAAGSGKTTVALHRIAYLVYNEAKQIKASNFMILGPNKYFLNYISDLLPNLDIRGVNQSTFEELALENINCKVKVYSHNSSLKDVLENKIDSNIIHFKSTPMFLKCLDNFILEYVSRHLQNDIVYNSMVLCNKERLQSICKTNHKNSSYKSKIDTLIKFIVNDVKNRSDDLSHEIWLSYREEFLSLAKDDPRRQEIIELTNSIQADLKKGCIKTVKKYFDFSKISPLALYRVFIENFDRIYPNAPVDIKQLQQYTLEKLSKKIVDSEDLTVLVYINYLLNGTKNYNSFTHLVIDEAQDLSENQYVILKLLFPKCTFDIFGDIHQSIYDYKSVKSWDKLNNSIFDSQAVLLNMDKSYRTTLQISNVSNLVLGSLNYKPSLCIAREGDEIDVYQIEAGDMSFILVNQINKLLEKGYQTIGIICKDDLETEKVYKMLKKVNLNINKITEDKEEYNGGLSIIPSYLSKGLEFDAIILSNANNINYTESAIDQKLLYVAITRAMHELIINYSGTITKSLSPLLDKGVARSLKK